MAAAFAQRGITVEYALFPWSRSYLNVKTGEWDGTFAWNRKPEREEAFHYSDPLLRKQRVFLHLKDYDFDWKSIDDLEGILIGAEFDTYYGDAFLNAEKSGKLNVDRVSTRLQNYRRLLLGRIRLYPTTVDVSRKFIAEYFTEKEAQRFTHHPRILQDTTYHLLLSKQVGRNVRLLKLFNEGLREL